MEAPLCRSPRRLNWLGMVRRAQALRVTSEPEARGTEERRQQTAGLMRERETHAELRDLHSPRSASWFMGRCAHAQWKGRATSGRGLSGAWSWRWAKPNTRGDSGSVRRGFEAWGAGPPGAVGGAGRRGETIHYCNHLWRWLQPEY